MWSLMDMTLDLHKTCTKALPNPAGRERAVSCVEDNSTALSPLIWEPWRDLPGARGLLSNLLVVLKLVTEEAG